MDFSQLKKRSSKNLQALTDKLEKLNGGGGGSFERDPNLWKPAFDKKEGKGYAVVRFLPNQHDESGATDFMQLYFHSFKGRNGFYFENSRKSIDQKEDDPIAISNALYWKLGEETGNEAYKNIARTRKRNRKYFANVYVIKDTVNPEHDGKVMVYEFGQQIFDKIQKALKPEYEDDIPMNPFDVFDGADLKIKIAGREIPDNRNPGQKIIVPNYEDSEFARQSEFMDGDETLIMEKFKQTHDLKPHVVIKPFEELCARYLAVTGEAYDKLKDDPVQEETERLAQQFKTEEQLPDQQDDDEEEENKPFTDNQDQEEESPLERFKRLAAGG